MMNDEWGGKRVKVITLTGNHCHSERSEESHLTNDENNYVRYFATAQHDKE